MAQETIADQPLIAEVTEDVNFPVDDSIVTYRATAAQIKNFVLAAQNVVLSMLKNDIFTGLTAVTPADDDYFPLVDTSDSNKTKKGLVSAFRNNTYRSVTTTDAVGVSDGTMKLSGASFTSTLPTAVGVAGKRYKFIHAGTSFSQVYTFATTSAQTIGGIASGSYSLYTAGEVLEVESDGANWLIVGRVTETAPTAFTPTYTGFGTVVTTNMRWHRRGTKLILEGRFTSATATGTEARMSFPTNCQNSASTYGTVEIVGNVATNTTSGVARAAHIEATKAYICFGISGANGGFLSKINGSSVVTSGDAVAIKAEIEIAGWQP